MTPSLKKAAKMFGCTLHGHIMCYKTEEEVPLTNDPVYKSRIVRYYSCINCPHTAEEESLTLKDEFLAK